MERFDKSKGFNEAQWTELVALFSGTRASELAQIKLDSVHTERGVLVLAIEEETKKQGITAHHSGSQQPHWIGLFGSG